LKKHLHAFGKAYNFARRIKILQGLTPYEFIVKHGQKDPEKFIVNPIHHTAGLYI
jgi:hypothetical protein